jgi:hypothetical protein
MKTKKDRDYSFRHTNYRLNERYGLSITQKEYDTICKNVKIMNGVLEEMGERRQKIVQIEFKGKLVSFVYEFDRDYITTVLTPK